MIMTIISSLRTYRLHCAPYYPGVYDFIVKFAAFYYYKILSLV